MYYYYSFLRNTLLFLTHNVVNSIRNPDQMVVITSPVVSVKVSKVVSLTIEFCISFCSNGVCCRLSPFILLQYILVISCLHYTAYIIFVIHIIMSSYLLL